MPEMDGQDSLDLRICVTTAWTYSCLVILPAIFLQWYQLFIGTNSIKGHQLQVNSIFEKIKKMD